MTISYVDAISDGSGAFIFLKILARWRGSLYKLVWRDLATYLFFYYVLNLTYRFLLTPDQKRVFESIVQFCDGMLGNIPVSFLLGFFVSGVISRWYQMYMYIPWMNHISYMTMAIVSGFDPVISLNIRLSLMRYINLSWILMMRCISDPIEIRFKQKETGDYVDIPNKCGCSSKTPDRLRSQAPHPWSISELPVGKIPSRNRLRTKISESSSVPLSPMLISNINNTTFSVPAAVGDFEAEDEWSIRATLEGFNQDKKIKSSFGKIITEEEIKAFEMVAKQYFKQTRIRYIPEYWVPLQWAVRLIQKAGLHGNIPDSKLIGTLISEVGKFRIKLQTLHVYSSIMIPLVYTQVVIIAVCSYFACQIMASQFIEVPKNSKEPVVDFYVPIFSIFYFLFLLGWLKVALCVMNPFGDDDEDFETSNILDYNLEISHRSVLMKSRTFPRMLLSPTLDNKPLKGADQDNLNEFIECVSRELDNCSRTYVDENSVKSTESRSHCFDCVGRKKSTARGNNNAAVLQLELPEKARNSNV